MCWRDNVTLYAYNYRLNSNWNHNDVTTHAVERLSAADDDADTDAWRHQWRNSGASAAQPDAGITGRHLWRCVQASSTFLWKPWLKKFIHGMHVHLPNIYGQVLYQGHWVKVTVTEQKKRVCISGSWVVCLRLKDNLIVYHCVTSIILLLLLMIILPTVTTTTFTRNVL